MSDALDEDAPNTLTSSAEGRQRLVYTAEEAAETLGVSYNTLRAWVREGRVPCLKIGNRLLFPREEFRRWLDGEARRNLLSIDQEVNKSP